MRAKGFLNGELEEATCLEPGRGGREGQPFTWWNDILQLRAAWTCGKRVLCWASRGRWKWRLGGRLSGRGKEWGWQQAIVSHFVEDISERYSLRRGRISACGLRGRRLHSGAGIWGLARDNTVGGNGS